MPDLASEKFLHSQAANKILFTKPYLPGRELEYIKEAISSNHLSGNGHFTEMCQHWLENELGSSKAFLTHSGTGALEMAAMLAKIEPGDEVIMPSFTFVSTASAFVMRGAVPVFVDIRADTLNIDENLIEAAITAKTRAIVPVHYAGVSCEMDRIKLIARQHDLQIIEDAAHALLAKYKGRPVGSDGAMSALSFHETKNIVSGEGGALLINDASQVSEANLVWDKGTDRKEFFEGRVDKYSWIRLGSSYLPNEITAAFLWNQLEHAKLITRKRLDVWNKYHELLLPLETAGYLRRPIVPEHCQSNGHIYYVLLSDRIERGRVLELLSEQGIEAVFHYFPLHLSPAGKKYCRSQSALDVTEDISSRLVRLPIWPDLDHRSINYIVDCLARHLT